MDVLVPGAGPSTVASRDPRRPTLTEIADAGFSHVIAVRAACGFVTGVPRRPASFRSVLRSSLPFAAVPLLVESLLLLTDSTVALRTIVGFVWVVALTLVDQLALLFSWRVWALVDRAAPELDQALDVRARAAAAAWLRGATSVGRQIGFSLFWIVVACVMLRAIEPSVTPRLEVSPVSYLCVSWSALIGGNCIYWMVALPILAFKVLRLDRLTLFWLSPAGTPAIAYMSDMFSFLTVAVMAAFLTIELLGRAASTYGSSPVLSVVTEVIPPASAVGAMVVGILPHAWLYFIVRSARRRTLDEIRSRIGGLPPGNVDEALEMLPLAELYRAVESSPNLPFSTTSMVQYAAAIVGTVCAFLLGS